MATHLRWAIAPRRASSAAARFCPWLRSRSAPRWRRRVWRQARAGLLSWRVRLRRVYSARWSLTIEKKPRVRNEQLRILKDRAIAGVRVNDEGRVRDILLQDERVDA